VLIHPQMSGWIEQARQAALARDPIAVLRDLEVLNQVLRVRCRRLIAVDP